MVLIVFCMNFGLLIAAAKTAQINAIRRTAASRMERCCVSKSGAITKRATDTMLTDFYVETLDRPGAKGL